jgi:hypothetical protein
MMWLRTLSESLENGATGKRVRPSAMTTTSPHGKIASRTQARTTLPAKVLNDVTTVRLTMPAGPAESQMSSRRTREKE